jgi:hypothetical protein
MDKVKSNASPVICAIDIRAGGGNEFATIYSIGAIIGNIKTGEMYKAFYERVEHKQPGRGTSDEVQDVWKELKGQGAYREVFDPKMPRKDLTLVLKLFNRFITDNSGEENPANGAIHLITQNPEKDISLLLHAMRQASIQPAWHSRYQDSLTTLDYTYRLLFGEDSMSGIPFKGTRHHAKDEAKHLFKNAHVIMRRLSEKMDLSAIL